MAPTINSPGFSTPSEPSFVAREEMQQKRKIREKQKQIIQQEKQKEVASTWRMILWTHLSIAIIAGIVAAIILYVFNPPITQTHDHDEFTQESQNWVAVLIVSMLVFIICFTVPIAIRFFNKIKSN